MDAKSHGDWSGGHAWTHFVDNLTSFLIFCVIGLIILRYFKRRLSRDNAWGGYCLSGFIFLCGVSHLAESLALIWPSEFLLWSLDILTITSAFLTIVLFIPMLPQLLKIPTVGDLQGEIRRRVETEARLRDSEETLRSAFTHAPIGMSLVSTAGQWMRVNQQVCQIVDYPEEELLQMTFQQITHPEDLHSDMDLLKACLRGERDSYSMEKRYIRKDGSVVPIQLYVSLVRDAARQPRFFVSQIKDIRQDKALQQQQRKLIGELQQKTDELQQIVYVASHDLRSPLVNIIGFSDELKHCCHNLKTAAAGGDHTSIGAIIDGEIPSILEFITSSAQRMDQLLNGLLQYSRMGRYPMTLELIDMNELVQGLSNEFSVQLRKIDGHFVVETLPPCYGDAILVSQLMSNLIDNAIKYRSPERRLELRATGEQGVGVVRYTLADNGIGIAPDHQADIFDIFNQINPSESTGEGLGLSICSLIANKLGGRIYVESVAGEGAAFHIEIPIAERYPDILRPEQEPGNSLFSILP
ncbi:MAG: PAS domain S-box protein [Verrucomicrobiota bacterium JB024]|nr:PAS domain S-box protein [Verrucomicrobiota bacterium JB024]